MRAQHQLLDDESLALEPAEDLADQAATHRVRLDEYERALAGRGGHCCLQGSTAAEARHAGCQPIGTTHPWARTTDILPFPPAPPRHSLTGTNGRSTVANQPGRPIAPVRKLVAAVLGTIAVFVMVFGLGLASWAIVALGAALLVLSVALAMVNVVRRGARAWVTGYAQVKAISEPPLTSTYGRAELQIVVVAPGLPTTEVLVRDPRVPVAKWPRVGDSLPVTVDVDDMRRVRIDWVQANERSDDGDPPPPPSFEPADDYPDDDLLGDVEPPPWTNRDRQWGQGPEEPPPPPAADYADETTDETTVLPDSPVIVHDTPAGPVLEGQFVDHDETPSTLPRRPTSGPTGQRPARSKPSPRPHHSASAAAAATATVDPKTAEGTDTASTEAATDSDSTTAPEQRATDEEAQPGPWSDPPTRTPRPRTTKRRSTCRWTAIPSPPPSCPPRHGPRSTRASSRRRRPTTGRAAASRRGCGRRPVDDQCPRRDRLPRTNPSSPFRLRRSPRHGRRPTIYRPRRRHPRSPAWT